MHFFETVTSMRFKMICINNAFDNLIEKKGIGISHTLQSFFALLLPNFACFIDRKPRELLKQYSRISMVDGTSFQANMNRRESIKDSMSPVFDSLQRTFSKKQVVNSSLEDKIDDKKGM